MLFVLAATAFAVAALHLAVQGLLQPGGFPAPLKESTYCAHRSATDPKVGD